MGLINYLVQTEDDVQTDELPLRDQPLAQRQTDNGGDVSVFEEKAEPPPSWVAEEAVSLSLLREASKVAHQIARVPQACMRNDRLSAIHQWGLPLQEALEKELFHYGKETMAAVPLQEQAAVFRATKKKL